MKKIVIVTGAGRGIGKALAIGLSRAGYTVVATARSLDKLQDLRSRLKNDYFLATCDITNWNDCTNLVNQVVEKYGKIGVLINNAGGEYVRTSLLESTKEQIDSVFDTQIKGTAFVTKAVLMQMAKQRSGKIYTITHAAYRLGPAYYGDPLKTLHVASLFGKAVVADLVAVEAKNYGVASIPVFIRWVASELDIDDPKDPARHKQANHPKEVAEAILTDLRSETSQKDIMVLPPAE